MKNKLSVGLLIFFTSFGFAQVNPGLNELVLKTTAVVLENPAQITLNWKHSTAPADKYNLYRKNEGGSNWTLLGTLGINDTTFVDQDVTVGQEYEYYLARINGSALASWGYISSGIKVLPDLINRGIILALDTGVTNGLDVEIAKLMEDLRADGFLVSIINTNANESVVNLKSKITQIYNTAPTVYNSLMLLGHVPVPYSGNLNPDAHTDHKGAWPTDLF